MTEAELLLDAEAISGVGGWSLDGATRRLKWTPQTFRLYGLAPEAVQPTLEQALSCVAADELPRVQACIEATLAHGHGTDVEFTIALPGGGTRRLRCTGAAVGAPGPGRRAVGTVQAVAAADGPQPPFGMGARSFEFAVAEAGVGIFEMDLETGQEVWSDQTLAIYGLPRGSPPPSRSYWREHFLHPDDEARSAARAEAFYSGGQPYELDYRVRRAGDGAVRWLHTRAAYAYGGRRLVLGITIDITERKLAEERAQEAHHALDVAATQADFGFGYREVRSDGGEWSPQLKVMFGLPPDAPTPTRAQMLALVDEADRRAVEHRLGVLPGTGEVLAFEYGVRRADGSRRVLMTRAVARSDSQGRPWRWYFVVIDVTERRQAEMALRAKELAERANAAKTEFLSRMSHELRTPLNAVLGFAQVMSLDQSDPLSDAHRARVAHIQTAGWHLLALINDVLDLSRIEARQTQLNPAAVPLADVVDECLAMNAAAATARGVAMSAPRVVGMPATVWADRTRLKQVLLNLMSNGIKYNRVGGRLLLELRALGADAVEIAVHDEGSGLTADQLARLFEPFNRLGRERGAIEGTGIGLALSRMLAEQMGGRLQAESQPGVGSVFRLTLPAHDKSL